MYRNSENNSDFFFLRKVLFSRKKFDFVEIFFYIYIHQQLTKIYTYICMYMLIMLKYYKNLDIILLYIITCV